MEINNMEDGAGKTGQETDRIIAEDEVETPEQGKDRIDEEQTKLLQMLIRRQEKDVMINRITALAMCMLLCILVVVFALLVPRFLRTLSLVDEKMESVSVFVDQAQQSLEEITLLVEDADDVILANEKDLAEAIDHFNNVDFDSLNESINNIREIIGPLSKVMSLLG
ncbi:MAG: hypothetical protein IKE03_01665 [Blautia sp.]|nr:hypothetical protein [Blautia sp.]